MKLETEYASPRAKVGFSGKNIIARYNSKLSGESIRKKLTRIPTYVLHREAKRPRTYNPFILYRPRVLLQADLIDMISRSADNDGIKYILIVVDCFTRFCWGALLENKTSALVLSKFKLIFKKTKHFQRFMTDAGSEFISKQFQAFLTQNNIKFVRGNPHAPHVERLNRTLQGKIFKYMTENETNRWISVFDEILDGYNNRHHSAIKMTPAKAELAKNHSKLLESVTRYYEKALNKRKSPRFKVRDIVSVQKSKSNFGKGYTQVFTDELFQIYQVHTKLPIPMYTLAEYDYDFDAKNTRKQTNKIIEGRFYANELQAANYDVFKVDKILDTKIKSGKQYVLVSWKGWPEKYNQWIPKDNISRQYNKA